MNLKTYLIILKTGVYLSFATVFFVFTNLLFPFITSKQIPFNVLVEVLMIFWLAMVIKYPSTRPKKSWITFGLAAFFSALLASTIFSIDFNLSFWGDVERMLGWFHIIHFFLFYLIIITVFRSWQDWRNLFIISVGAATLVCFNSFLNKAYSTIGNTAYVSGYAIFNIYFALILFFRNREAGRRGGKNWLVGSLYLAAALIMFAVLAVTRTRGAYVGLGASLLLMMAMFVYYSQSRKVKIYSFGAAAIGVILITLVFLFPQSKLVQNTPILRTATEISFKAVTFQTRLLSWKAAFKDFPSHPILGTGYGNYAITFDKYFDPKFYDYTTAETYFDRAHNNLIDLASTAGLLGLLSYLSILAACVYYLFKGKKENKISTTEFILLICLLTAYFIQNLAVFDSLVTYISLMLALAFTYWLVREGDEVELNETGALSNKEISVLAVAGLILLFIVYQGNIKPWQMLDGTIKGQIELNKGNIPGAIAAYKQALSYQTGLDRDSRASLINGINSRQNELTSLGNPQAGEIADYVIGLAEANVKLDPLDSMMQMQLAQILNTAAIVNQSDKNKFYYYSDRAIEAIDKSIAASPGRVTIYFAKAQIYLTRNDGDNAIKTLKQAVALNENYNDSICFLAKIEIYFLKDKATYDNMDKCLDNGGSGLIAPLEYLRFVLDHYTQKNDLKRMIALYQGWTALEPSNSQILVNLALLYGQVGDKANAIAAAEKAVALDPQLRPAADTFISNLK